MAVLDFPTKEEYIDRLAAAGACFSKHLRNCWTGELERPTLRLDSFSGRSSDLWAIARLQPPLIDIATVADLSGVVYMGTADQHTWSYERWKKEIERRI